MSNASNQQQTTAFVMQQQVPAGVAQVSQSATTILPYPLVTAATILPYSKSDAAIVQATSSMQGSRGGNVNLTHQQSQQIVKVVTASSQSSNMIGTVQHVQQPMSQAQQQLQQVCFNIFSRI